MLSISPVHLSHKYPCFKIGVNAIVSPISYFSGLIIISSIPLSRLYDMNIVSNKVIFAKPLPVLTPADILVDSR